MDQAIERFIAQRHIAVVGVSDKKFGGAIYKTLKKRGFDVYPVHPSRNTFDGDTCYSRLGDVPIEVKAAVVAVSPDSAAGVVEDALAAGITQLWFQQGKNFSDAVNEAQAGNIATVSGKCILMYAEPVSGIHAFHRFLARIFGRL